jgi:hypothetical protein
VNDLDHLAPERYDVDALVAAANDYEKLSEDERDNYVGVWDFAGLDEASHPLGALLWESHNQTAVVRGLDGQLYLVFETSAGSRAWSCGPLYRDNLINEDLIYEQVEGDPEWLSETFPGMSVEQLVQLVNSLPPAGGPVILR